MFHNSTQRQHWVFKSEQELEEIRKHSNVTFCESQEPGAPVLDHSEELELFRYYQKKLVELCNLFAPPKWVPLPRSALATAVAYFKRFYLYTSVMEYHPQDIYLSCAFLAFKIDEYNVTLEQFIETLSPFFPRQQLEHISDFILSHELFLLQKLKFHLTIHSSFRPLGGFLVDMKTRSHDLPDPEQFRKVADKFLLHSLHSDVSLLFPPSQIALAGLWHSAKQTQTQIDRYISSILLNSEPASTVQSLTSCLTSKLLEKKLHTQGMLTVHSVPCIEIENMVLAVTLPDRASIATADEKLSHFLLSASQSRKRKSDEVHPATKKHKHSNEGISGIDKLPTVS